MQRVPLAERMRPKTLDDVIGQEHLLGENGILRQIVKNKEPVSLILWGPPGSGKTTLARIIAGEVNAEFIELSAVTSGKKDVEAVIAKAKANWATADGRSASHLSGMQGNGEEQTETYTKYGEGAPQQMTLQTAKSVGGDYGSARRQVDTARRTVLFVDEIHRFNKAQQDAFLPHVESGLITLIGATTENPSFEVINPLLSRTRVLILEPLGQDDIVKIIKKVIKAEKLTKRVTPKAINYIAKLAGGDARVALGDLELALSMSDKVTPETVEAAAQKHLPAYDKKGDMHYNVISAFIKSMRGGDADAALYYLERMLEVGEDPKFIARRMIIFASEDIGLVGNGALGLALNAFQAVERIGMPESNIILAHVVTALTKSKKSRETTEAMFRAQELAKRYPNLPVPTHLRNAPTKLMKNIGYGEDYEWKAGFQHEKGFLPDELKDEKIF